MKYHLWDISPIDKSNLLCNTSIIVYLVSNICISNISIKCVYTRDVNDAEPRLFVIDAETFIFGKKK